jgi:molecular chaperone DnaK
MKSIGIDLGLTHSVMAFKPSRSVEILRNKENQERTPSCVAMRGNEILAGRSAFQVRKYNPENTIFSIRRFLGASYDDEITKKAIAENKNTIVRLNATDDIAFVLNGKQYTPEQICAEILKKLKQDAEERLNDEVTHAVITVPAYFTDKQKNATRLAAKYAGLKVQKILSEPTAVAIAYGVDELAPGNAKTVLIYQFGRESFDLSILNILDGQYLEMGIGGDRWLGGKDIDNALSNYIYDRTCDKYGIDRDSIDDLISNLSFKKKFRFLSDFREKVEEVKIGLSSANSFDFILENILEDENGDEIDINLEITRKEFENLIRPFVQRSIDLIEELIHKMNYDMDMTDAILLAGGTSSIPLVKKMLATKYGKDKIKLSKEPMLVIAAGAAILAHRDANYEAADTQIDEVMFTTGHDYFIKMNTDGVDKREKVIEKEMPIPFKVSKIFKTTTNTQRIIAIEIENDIEDGKYESVALGFYLIDEDVPINSSFVFDFKVGFGEDSDDIIYVSAYPQGEKHKSKAILLSRGGREEKTLNILNNLFERAIKEANTFDILEDVIDLIAKKIREISNIGIERITNEDWARIAYTVEEEYKSIKGNEGESNKAMIHKLDNNRNMNTNLFKLYDDFDNIGTTIKKGFPELSKKVDKFKPYLFSRLIGEYFENEAFEQLIAHITTFEDFYKRPELLKNVGIACLRMANNQQITKANYEIIISTWLTAVYSDRVILNSLEITDWDDDYTFTLLNSIGSKYAFENEVENVNFEEVSDNNICIGETQRQLVSFFETALNEIPNASLGKKVQVFYNTEKEATEKIIATISTEIIYAAPHFAKKHDLNGNILKHLVTEFKAEQDTNILEVGLLYSEGKQPAIFESYQTAQNFVSNALHAIKNKRSTTLDNQNIDRNKNALAQFPKMGENFEAEMNREFHTIAQEETENVAMITLFEKAIDISSNKEQLRGKCADFIANLVISKVNDGNMNNEKALSYLIKAYGLSKNNHKVLNNLATIVRFNCSDMLNGDISDATRKKLEDLATIKNGLLTQSLRNELLEMFNIIMTGIRENNEEVIGLFEKEIGIKKTIGSLSGRSNLDVLMGHHNTDIFGPSLTSEGLQLAAKLKIIYNLI